MRTLQLYATGTATANAAAQIIIPSSTRIKQVQIALLMNCVTDDGRITCELNKAPQSQIGTNGPLDPFLEVGLYSNFLTSGLAQSSLNHAFPVDVDCRQGEIIYLHVLVSGTVTYFFNGILWYGG